MIKYLMNGRSGITDSINHNFGKIRINLYNSLPIEKVLTFHNVMIIIRIKITTTIFLGKGSYEDKSDTRYF